MINPSQIINLDKPQTFVGVVCEFLWKKGYEKNLHQWLAADEVRCRRFATFIETGGRDGDAGDFGAVATEFHSEFWEQYDFYTGFHGCFVENPDDYRLRGIRAGNPDEIYRIAVEKFGREEKIRAVFEDLRETGYLEHNTGKVFAVQPIEYFKEDGGFCHAKGSELLGMVAKKNRFVLRRYLCYRRPLDYRVCRF